MRFGFRFPTKPVPASLPEFLLVGSQRVPLRLVRHPRARRYILRLRADGVAQVTVPARGSLAEACAFAQRQTDWVARQLQFRAQPDPTPPVWQDGTGLLYRGQLVRLRIAGPFAHFAEQTVRFTVPQALRQTVERKLRLLAAQELPTRTRQLADQHGLMIGAVTVRNQRSRWGSCSRGGNISLNWRLIQMPPQVSDYIIRHELAHLREPNHSSRFWSVVAEICPDYQAAERWLKNHRQLLQHGRPPE